MPKTFLRTPELVEEIELVATTKITCKDIFERISRGEIVPDGYLRNVPLFDVLQVGKIAKVFRPEKGKAK